MIQSKGSANESKLAISYHSTSSDGTSLPRHTNLQTVVVSIVNPQGTVTTVTSEPILLDESFSSDNYIHENCDETMFRPVVTVMSDKSLHHDAINDEDRSQPLEMPSQLIVPVIDEKMLETKKRERELEQTRKQLESERAKIAIEEANLEEKRKVEQENEDALRAEQNKGKKEKAEETPATYQKRGKKAQKYNKKSSEFDKKPTEKKDQLSSENVWKASEKVDDVAIKSDDMLSQLMAKIELEANVVEVEEKKTEKPEEKLLETPEKLKVLTKEKIQKTPAISSWKDMRSVPFELKETIPAIKEPLAEPSPVFESIPKNFVEQPIATTSKLASAPSFSKFESMLKNSMARPAISSPASASAPNLREMKLEKFDAVKPETIVKAEPAWKKKKGKKGKTQPCLAVEEDFPQLGSPHSLFPIEDHRIMDNDAILKISMHETIGDDEIEIIPHENAMEIQDSPEKPGLDIELVDEHFEKPSEQKFIKNEDFYDIDDDLPPLEPLESFDVSFDPLSYDESPVEKTETEQAEEMPSEDVEDVKEKMKTKMSELLKDTNMVFAMCSSLKEMKDDEDSKSLGSSQIQRSTSSSLTTNTTTATFASASSNQTGEGQDSDYKSLELEMDENAQSEPDFKVPADLKLIDDAEDISSFEATSSETDDSSRKSTTVSKFKREDDEELRPLLQTSVTSLSSPAATASSEMSTEANDTSTLPETNQKSSSQPTSNNGNKRKNKKKRR